MRVCINPGNTLGGLFQDVCRLTCCTALLNSPLSPHLIFPSSPQFQPLVNAHYAINTPLHPACFLQPQSTSQVSLAVSILVSADDGSPSCQFAIRGGGHTPWKGAAGVEGGVTIDMALMNETVYRPETGTVEIMAGARWGTVYQALRSFGVAVTGGRSDSVGVAGLVMGGGLSYFAPEFGLACDNVVSFEIVLSTGKVTTATQTSNPDLFRALKGSGPNFGIITQISLRAFAQGPNLWGGVISHEESAIPGQITALVNFTSHLAGDLHANLVTIWQYNGKSNASLVASGVSYSVPVVVGHGSHQPPSIFREIVDLPQTFSTLRETDIHDLMMETAPPPGKRALFLTLTFQNEARVLERLLSEHRWSVAAVVDSRGSSEDWDAISFLQPFPAVFGKVGKERGGNVLGLEGMDGDHLLYLLFLSWDSPADDSLFHDIGYGLIRNLKAYTKEVNADSDYIYMNYAGRDQNPLRGYGEDNLKWIAAMAKKYDPIGVFQTQARGGFKVSAA
ncbi:hypothetical protein BDW59DRAFT_180510 [Aspergillus cavernicola]|uniref:FAD-binding PCMH-type domain-containing protein n=1 Tax=Aspergillus cavernicola TaxID=176166 RepID=A0ABR4IYM6_9EURO